MPSHADAAAHSPSRGDLLARLLGDWELRACARHGHITFAPAEPDLARALHTETEVGTAWRCLRCGAFILGSPKSSGPAAEAPEVPRGPLLRDRWIMRLLATERGLRAVILFAAAAAVWRFRKAQTGLADLVAAEVPLLRPAGQRIGWNPDQSWIVHLVNRVVHASPHTLTLVLAGLLGYALLEALEAVGLWSAKRWGEYLAVIATGVFIPLEVWELIHRATILKIGAFAVNVFLVVWLIWSKRLFGVRGGYEAFRAQHAVENLLAVRQVAGDSQGS